MRRALLALIAVAGAACSSGGGMGPASGMGGSGGTGGAGAMLGMDHSPDAPFFAALPSGAEQLHNLCARGNQDLIAKRLCATPAPAITSIADLQHAVGFFDGPSAPNFALLGHSTSLIIRSVSSINPRAIVFTAPSGQPTTQPNDGSFIQDPGFMTLGFARGAQFVELAAHDPQKNELHFYLVRFIQDCNTSASGCTPGDLLTPAVEKSWRAVTVYEDQDLKNTVFDCLHCHQPDGPSARKMLRMQERRAPWTHWFRNNSNQPGGVTLVQDFQAAHGNHEDYAGIPAHLLDTPAADPLVFEALIDNNTLSPQPNEFNTTKIEQQVKQSQPSEPAMNMPPGQSSTWNSIYTVAAQGNAIPVPYHDVKVTDPQKLGSMSAAYQRFVAGGAAAQLPDITDVLLDAALPDMGLKPRPGASGLEIVQQMCQRCHNSNLDQTISRSHFDVMKIATLSRGEKDLAIARITQPAGATALMPPARFGQLGADEIQTVVNFLKQ